MIDIAGEASFMMNMQELSTLSIICGENVHHNNEWMGMVRQWQELIHGGRIRVIQHHCLISKNWLIHLV